MDEELTAANGAGGIVHRRSSIGLSISAYASLVPVRM